MPQPACCQDGAYLARGNAASLRVALTRWVLGRLPAGEDDVAAAERTLLEVSLLGLQEA